jgi:hypothetical protein
MEERVKQRVEELQEELHETAEAVFGQSDTVEYQDVAVIFLLHKIASLQCGMEDILRELKKDVK